MSQGYTPLARGELQPANFEGSEVKHLVALLEKTFKRPESYSHKMSREEIAEREGQQQVMNFIRKNVRG